MYNVHGTQVLRGSKLGVRHLAQEHSYNDPNQSSAPQLPASFLKTGMCIVHFINGEETVI